MEDNSSLRSLLLSAEQFCQSLQYLNTGDAATQELIKTRISELEDLTRRVAALELFSVNETYTESDPRSLPFLLLPALLGHLTLHLCDFEHRKSILDSAEVYFKDFLTRIKSYDIIDAALHWVDADSDVGTGSVLKSNKDPAKMREIKIAKLKESQQLDETIAKLEKLGDDADDNVLRELYVAKLQRWANDAFERLREIEMERPMVDMMEQRKSETAENSDSNNQPTASVVPRLMPVILTKNDVQKRVFGAGYPAVPTLTVTEWYDQMNKEGWFNNKGGGNAQNRAAVDPETAEEIERRKQIDWDQYTEDNPRGYGNTLNKG